MGLIGTAIQVAATAHENSLQRKFAERMSSTAYQRGMKDMKKAGLNPILAYKTGGASTPTAGGTGFKTDIDLASTAMQVLQGKAAISNVKQQEATSAQNAKTIEQNRINAKPGLEYQAQKDRIKLGVLNSTINSAKGAAGSVKIRPANAVTNSIQEWFDRAKEYVK